MHLLPQSFVLSGASLLLPGASVGTAALLLPAAVRFFSESLPHLLPRQAFSFRDRGFSRTQSRVRLPLPGSGADDSCLKFEGRDEVLSQTRRQSGRPGGSSLRVATPPCRRPRIAILAKAREDVSSSGRISPVDLSSLPFQGMLRSSPRPRLPWSASQSMKIVTIG